MAENQRAATSSQFSASWQVDKKLAEYFNSLWKIWENIKCAQPLKFKKDEKRTEVDEKIVSTIVIAQVELSGVWNTHMHHSSNEKDCS